MPPQRAGSRWWTRYAVHYLKSMLNKEALRPTLKLISPQLQYRAYMVMCMKDSSKKLNLGNCVLHTGVWLLDYFMDNHSIHHERLRSVAFTCLYVAAKFELEGRSLPSYSEFCRVGEVEHLERHILMDLEFAILYNINWDMMMPNVSTFLDFYRQYIITNEDCNVNENNFQSNSSFSGLRKAINLKLDEYLSVTLQDVQLCLLPPSLLALACLMASRKSQRLTIWPVEYSNLSRHTEAEIHTVSLRISKMLDITNCSQSLKRRYQPQYSDEEDQGYCTAKSSPGLPSPKRVRKTR